MLVSCQGQQGDDNNTDGPINGGGITGKIELTVDKVLIQADGTDYATLTVSLDGKAVSEGVTFFDGKNNILDLNGFKFSTEVPGNYEIWANYGTYNTDKVLLLFLRLQRTLSRQALTSSQE